MHVFIGGAHNGKRDYVKRWLTERGKRNVQWFEGNCPDASNPVNPDATQTIVVAGIEKWLAETKLSEEAAVEYVMKSVSLQQDTVLILTDIGRGIVPIDANQRRLRDTVGRLYQRLLAEADDVTRIWYGLAKPLKKRGDFK